VQWTGDVTRLYCDTIDYVAYVAFVTPLWSRGQEFLATGPEVRVRFPKLPDFLRSSGSETVFTYPREYNLGMTWG
jgi:hypothetical protein